MISISCAPSIYSIYLQGLTGALYGWSRQRVASIYVCVLSCEAGNIGGEFGGWLVRRENGLWHFLMFGRCERWKGRMDGWKDGTKEGRK